MPGEVCPLTAGESRITPLFSFIVWMGSSTCREETRKGSWKCVLMDSVRAKAPCYLPCGGGKMFYVRFECSFMLPLLWCMMGWFILLAVGSSMGGKNEFGVFC